MIRNKVWLSVGVVPALIVVIFMIIRFESDFTNPNDGVKAPVGIWKVEDLKAIADEASPNSDAAQLVYSETAKIVQIDVLHDDIFAMTFEEIDSFSVFTDTYSDERYILAHDADLFARWDDIYPNGAVGALIGTDRDTQEKVYYPVIVFSPDFDTQSAQIVYSVRNQTDTKVSAELIKLIPKDFVAKQLQLFSSVDLVNATLIIDPVELPEF